MYTILLTEDSRFLRTALEHMLTAHGYSVLTAGDGEEALQIAASAPIDLMVLDIVLPRCQGFEVLTRLKQDPNTSSIPVLIVSKVKLDEKTRTALHDSGVFYVEKAELFLNDILVAIEMALQFAADRQKLETQAGTLDDAGETASIQ